MTTKLHYGKLGGNVAYHGYQSFAEGEVTPEECHIIGVETAKRMWGDKYEIVTANITLNGEELHVEFTFRTGDGDNGKFYRTEICEKAVDAK